MEHPWRSQIFQGGVCPTCSISHIPSCRSPLYTVDQSSAFQPGTSKFFRPPSAVDWSHTQFHYHVPGNGSGEQQPWAHYPPSFSEPSTKFLSQTQAGLHSSNNFYVDGCLSHPEVSIKRMRVESTNSDGYPVEYHQNDLRSIEDERRLKLIREHGVSTVNFPQGSLIHTERSDLFTHQGEMQSSTFHEPCFSAADRGVSQFGKHFQSKGNFFPSLNDSNDGHANTFSYSRGQHSARSDTHMRPGTRQLYHPARNPDRLPLSPFSLHHHHRAISIRVSEDIPYMEEAQRPSIANHSPSERERDTIPQPFLRNNMHSQSPSTIGETCRGPGKKALFIDPSNTMDASHLFREPHRSTRPTHIVVICRGLPGSGKSYLAKMLRDLEVESGGNAPRIHSLDDYFITEVEKADGDPARGRKVMEYCYESEMEEVYRASMLKAFTRTLEEGVFTFVIVDDRNLRVADFARFWATAKKLGYEAYLLEAPCDDPAGCAARNVHGFTEEDVVRMAKRWEDASCLYARLDTRGLLSGQDEPRQTEIREVDMDVEDECEHGEQRHFAQDLAMSKWSGDLDDDAAPAAASDSPAGEPGLRSGTREGKSVKWNDGVCASGFSIGAAGRGTSTLSSLIIGPGAGYNSTTNPLAADDVPAIDVGERGVWNSVFQERVQAERESLKAIFDRRRRVVVGGFPRFHDQD